MMFVHLTVIAIAVIVNHFLFNTGSTRNEHFFCRTPFFEKESETGIFQFNNIIWYFNPR